MSGFFVHTLGTYFKLENKMKKLILLAVPLLLVLPNYAVADGFDDFPISVDAPVPDESNNDVSNDTTILDWKLQTLLKAAKDHSDKMKSDADSIAERDSSRIHDSAVHAISITRTLYHDLDSLRYKAQLKFEYLQDHRIKNQMPLYNLSKFVEKHLLPLVNGTGHKIRLVSDAAKLRRTFSEEVDRAAGMKNWMSAQRNSINNILRRITIVGNSTGVGNYQSDIVELKSKVNKAYTAILDDYNNAIVLSNARTSAKEEVRLASHAKADKYLADETARINIMYEEHLKKESIKKTLYEFVEDVMQDYEPAEKESTKHDHKGSKPVEKESTKHDHKGSKPVEKESTKHDHKDSKLVGKESIRNDHKAPGWFYNLVLSLL